MELPLGDYEDCQKPQIKDVSLSANMNDIHKTMPANSQSSRRFRARSCKSSRPTETITIDLTEDDNNDTTIPCTNNQSNDQIMHTDDASDKDGGRPVVVSKEVKRTPFQVSKADVPELQRGSDMHEFLLCLGSNVLKDITCNGGRGLVNEDHKETASITESPDLPAGRLERNSPCDSGWGVVNDHSMATPFTETPSDSLSNRLTKDSSGDDGWGTLNEDPCNVVAQKKATLSQNSWSAANKVENRDTSWDIPSQNSLNDDGWGMVNEDTCKVTKQEKETLIQTSWSGANEVENRDMSRDRKRNRLDCIRSEVEGKIGNVSSINDTYEDNMKEDRRRSGKYAPSGANLVPLGERKTIVNGPDREDPCDSGWEVINDKIGSTDIWKEMDEGHKDANPAAESPDLWVDKLKKSSPNDDGWGMPSEDLCKATAQEKAALIPTSWSAVNKIESRDMSWDIPGQDSNVPNKDTVITTRNPSDCIRSEIREQSKQISSMMNDSNGENINEDRRRSGKYAPSGANMVPLGKRKTTNQPDIKDPCASGWKVINEETGCTDGWNVEDKNNKITAPTTESPLWVGSRETDLPFDDGWAPMNEEHNPMKEALCDSWGGRLEKDSHSGSVWGNASEDQHKVTAQENTNLFHTPWSGTNDIENRDVSLDIPSQGFEVSDLNLINRTQNSPDCFNLGKKGQNVHLSTNDTYGDKVKRKSAENNWGSVGSDSNFNDQGRRSGRYEPSGANLVPLGKKETTNRRYIHLWDQSMSIEHSEALIAAKNLAISMRKILHLSGYSIGSKLSIEDQREVVENALAYHLDKDNKIGCGVDYVTIDTHPDHQAQCFFVVRKDGSRSDFSYWKCIKGMVQEKYPDHANEVFEYLR